IGKGFRRGTHGCIVGIERDSCACLLARELSLTVARKSCAHEILNGRQDALGFLPGDEPARNFYRGLGGNDRLCAHALVAAGDAVELERRARPELLQHRPVALASRLMQPDSAKEVLAIEAE